MTNLAVAPLKSRALLIVFAVLWPSVASATFSIIARDPATGEIGLAVASKVFAVRLGVGVIDPEAGVIARQADVRVKDGLRAMELLKTGLSPAEVIAEMLKRDLLPTHQIAIIDITGRVAASTGKSASEWKGYRTGDNYSVQGNILVGPQVIDAMAMAFESTQGPLAERLFAALQAGDKAGGDKRGRQSAFLTVVKKGAAVYGEPMVNIAVDDSLTPLTELRRLLDVQTGWNLAITSIPLVVQGKLTEAHAAFRRIVSLSPDNQDFRMWLAALTHVTGDRGEALSIWRSAQQMGEERTQAFLNQVRFFKAFQPFLADAEFHSKPKDR